MQLIMLLRFTLLSGTLQSRMAPSQNDLQELSHVLTSRASLTHKLVGAIWSRGGFLDISKSGIQTPPRAMERKACVAMMQKMPDTHSV